MAIIFTLVFFVCLLILILNWRWGIFLILLVGFVQDPIRKTIAGQPVAFSTLVIFAFALCLVLTFLINNSWRFRHVTLGNSQLEFFTSLFVMFVLFSGFWSYYKTSNILVALVGVSIYLGPIVAAVYSNHIFDSLRSISAYLTIYLCFIFVLIVSIGLSVSGIESILFEEIGGGIDIYEHTIGNYLDAHSGFARSGEIAAWHLATGACFSLILGVNASGIKRVILYLLAFACLFAGVFTGRRKMYGLFFVFLFALILLMFFESNTRRKNYAFVSALVICSFGVFFYWLFKSQSVYLSFANDYLSRAFTVFGSATDRLEASTSLFSYSLLNTSILGDGVGTTGQAIEGYAGNARWSSESGFGRLGNEMGLLGLLVIVCFLFSLLAHVYKTNLLAKKVSVKLAMLQRALIAYLFANSVNYFTAAQVYNDLFVLLTLGMVLGIILTIPKVGYRMIQRSA